MIALAVIGTYLMIGSFVAIFAWSKRDQSEWLANHPLINSLTFLSVMIFWPRIFVVFVRVVRRRLKERREALKIKTIKIEGTPFVLSTRDPKSGL